MTSFRMGITMRVGSWMIGAATASALALVTAGCNGGDTATQSTTASNGAGGVANEVAIVASPASGPCAASGTTALQSPGLNSKLDCAP